MLNRILIILIACLLPALAAADDRLVRLAAPSALTETGVFKHILPRFSLKTSVKVQLVEPGASADVALGPDGRAVFDGLGETWHMDVLSPDHPGSKKFSDWLASEIGLRTLASFQPEGAALFGPPTVAEVVVAEVEMSGDAILGHEVSLAKCTRCHAVDEATKGRGIGSTPSFGVLRALRDWEDRFAAFYVLNPHPAFTLIEDLSEPFPDDRPSPIVPIELTLDEVEAILAYVAAMPATDLGAPLAHQ